MTIATIMAAVPALIEIGSKGKSALEALADAWASQGREPAEFWALVKDEQAARAKWQTDGDAELDRLRGGG